MFTSSFRFFRVTLITIGFLLTEYCPTNVSTYGGTIGWLAATIFVPASLIVIVTSNILPMILLLLSPSIELGIIQLIIR